MDTPAAWLTTHSSLLPRSGTALDVASGTGRHALWLAAHGLTVTAIDRNAAALATLGEHAAASGLKVQTIVQDLETPQAELDRDRFDVVVVIHYLHRPLFPALMASLRPGGILVYETFTTAQAAMGRPSNPDFLLEPGELLHVLAPLEVIDSREGYFDGRHIASVVARRPARA